MHLSCLLNVKLAMISSSPETDWRRFTVWPGARWLQTEASSRLVLGLIWRSLTNDGWQRDRQERRRAVLLTNTLAVNVCVRKSRRVMDRSFIVFNNELCMRYMYMD